MTILPNKVIQRALSKNVHFWAPSIVIYQGGDS